MEIRIDRADPVPIHNQIEQQIIGLIHSGRLKAGEQLPTMRALSIELAVNFNTVAHAYRELDAQGIISTRRGEGTFVATTPGEDEMLTIRRNKLERLVRDLVSEVNRLGYSPQELQQALAPHLAPATEEN
jgi:GntR family transcriptional regulator